jgi:hypothetical protein
VVYTRLGSQHRPLLSIRIVGKSRFSEKARIAAPLLVCRRTFFGVKHFTTTVIRAKAAVLDRAEKHVELFLTQSERLARKRALVSFLGDHLASTLLAAAWSAPECCSTSCHMV